MVLMGINDLSVVKQAGFCVNGAVENLAWFMPFCGHHQPNLVFSTTFIISLPIMSTTIISLNKKPNVMQNKTPETYQLISLFQIIVWGLILIIPILKSSVLCLLRFGCELLGNRAWST
jgi:hypothetical protein